jgi:hypothetical protein
MSKDELLKHYGNTKVRHIAGILHNYTQNDTMEEHLELEKILKKWGDHTVNKSITVLEEYLFF